MILQPLEEFAVVRGLEDHTDSTTYYVQAVIRNAKTDAVLATLNLDDKGDGHRFMKKWQVPADQTGLGYYITIIYSVYTDSSYTTKADNYGDNYQEYLVQERVNPLLNRGGGDDMDYILLEKIVHRVVAAEVGKLPPPAEPQEMPNVAFHVQPVLNAVAGLRNDIQDIELPPTDFSGIEYRLNLLEDAVKAVEIPETDLSPVLKAISALQDAIQPYSDKTSQDAEAMLERIRQFFNQDMEEIKKQVAGVNGTLAKMPFLLLGSPKESPVEQPEKPQVDYSQLLK